MYLSKYLFLIFCLLSFSYNITCKIVLPHKLRYLENMLNSEVVAKATKIRQRIEGNPNMVDTEKNWPMLLAKYQSKDSLLNEMPFNIPGNKFNKHNRYL